MQIKIEQTKEQILAKSFNVLDNWAETHPQGTVPRIPDNQPYRDPGLLPRFQ